MTRILERIRAGEGRIEDLDRLVEVAGSMGIIPGTTICGLSDGAAWPVKNAIKKFRGEFEEYIRGGRKSVTSAQQLMAAAH
jgi:NADH-quinone oxidoreductase subunit F